ncbi:MAG: excinuclease ABC subunit UvrC [Gammaproteobacteria bacterium]|jgi:excinuclease ABC subunit C|nr:excinuclease ABC subunit UvrC [Gammaproteobacteria bacterium]MBT4491995.1 excinuclease ABC subunit UvrC [Gammaproteobacteria bacterium]MBT7370728.1 excinuclease ABC subunit UvrC [Gammaproteobacteria bacterium]
MTEFDAKSFLKTLPTRPGVYRMQDEAGEVLYVGKAKSLKSRVSSYFRSTALDVKTMALVAKIADVQTTVTGSETEALLLEQSLIKEYRPPYNIVFRDDKSYPYIFLSSEDRYPRLAFHRGAQKKKGRYFGPFPSAYSVRDSLNILQKVFQVRQCEDTFFKNRTRPCLQYQIKRCSGPCCDLISPGDYADDVDHAVMFLEGRSKSVMNDYANKMEEASKNLDFERAAHYRDQVTHLRRIQEQQYVVGDQGDIDVMAVTISPGGVCVLVMFIRGGRLLGNKTYFPKTRLDEDEAAVLGAFLPQFYLTGESGRETPSEVIVSAQLEDKSILAEALSEKAGRKISLSDSVRTHRKRWVDLAVTNAEQSLGAHLANRNNLQQRFRSLQEAMSLEELPMRLECFDISHSSGEATVASCVVFDQNGPLKSDYRRFNIDDITPGDDYAAMSQALNRRYTRLKKGEGQLPDILFIDGGKGQLGEAEKIMEELQIEGVLLVGVAKGPGRKAGLETLIVSNGPELQLPPDSPALHLIQHIRDESHRFAITAHRNRRGKKRTESILEGIDGVGPKRRRALLRHFGGTAQVHSASAEELAKVEGINSILAEHIYATLHH